LLVFLSGLLMTLQGHTQENHTKIELRGNVLYGAFKIIDVHFEFTPLPKIGVGVSAAWNLKDNEDFSSSYSVFARYYTAQANSHNGFFVEMHFDLMLNDICSSGRDAWYIGPSIGYKHFLNDRIHIEALV